MFNTFIARTKIIFQYFGMASLLFFVAVLTVKYWGPVIEKIHGVDKIDDAVKNNCIECLEEIFENDEVWEAEKKTTLWQAIEQDKLNIVLYLKKKDDNIFNREDYEYPFISIAVKNGSKKVFDYFFKFDKDILRCSKRGVTALHSAALNKKNGLYFLKRMLSEKEDVFIDPRDICNRTPLFYALDNKEYDTAIVFLEKGADITIENCKGLTPKDLILESKDERLVKYLSVNENLMTEGIG